jgi:integrase
MTFTVMLMIVSGIGDQRFTGCRPGEACAIRRCDIDTGGTVWLYKLSHHKTSHRGKSRVIAIGPKAQELLKQFFAASNASPDQ